MEGDAGAFAAEEGLGDVAGGGGQFAGAVEVGGEEVGMTRVQLPEDGEEGLVAEEHLPGGLDPQCGPGAAAADVGVVVPGGVDRAGPAPVAAAVALRFLPYDEELEPELQFLSVMIL